MITSWRAVLGLTAMLAATSVGGHVLLSAPNSPYAGQERRDIKALSTDEIASLEKGEGMGMARAAELNHYPGPLHVLHLAETLALSSAQREATNRSFESMHARSLALGSKIVELERQLDALFADGKASPGAIEELTIAIGRTQGELRAAHLAAHARMRAILTPEQIRQYDHLRGYGAGVGGNPHSSDAAGHSQDHSHAH